MLPQGPAIVILDSPVVALIEPLFIGQGPAIVILDSPVVALIEPLFIGPLYRTLF